MTKAEHRHGGSSENGGRRTAGLEQEGRSDRRDVPGQRDDQTEMVRRGIASPPSSRNTILEVPGRGGSCGQRAFVSPGPLGLLNLGPFVLQRDRAVEHRLAARGVGVYTEIALPLELADGPRLGCGQAGLHPAAG